jgi:rRNA maturation RNase YbeY
MSLSKIYFFTENIPLNLKHKRKIRHWIFETIKKEQKMTGNINFIFCNDSYLLKINKQFLNKDTLTDVIAFDYCENNIVSGDIYISYERVTENAKNFKSSAEKEVHRIIIHGVLHLTGYQDKTDMAKQKMKIKEDEYLKNLII